MHCNDDAFLEQKSKAEQALRAVAAISGPDPWQDIATASSRERVLYLPYIFIENAAGFSSALFRDARLLLRAPTNASSPIRIGCENLPMPNCPACSAIFLRKFRFIRNLNN